MDLGILYSNDAWELENIISTKIFFNVNYVGILIVYNSNTHFSIDFSIDPSSYGYKVRFNRWDGTNWNKVWSVS